MPNDFNLGNAVKQLIWTGVVWLQGNHRTAPGIQEFLREDNLEATFSWGPRSGTRVPNCDEHGAASKWTRFGAVTGGFRSRVGNGTILFEQAFGCDHQHERSDSCRPIAGWHPAVSGKVRAMN